MTTSSEDRLLVLYHAECSDGFGAALAVWKALGESAQYMAVNYNQPPPTVHGRHVLIVDFSYKAGVLAVMGQDALSVTVLDHHETAEAELAAFTVDPEVMVMMPEVYRAYCSEKLALPVRALFDQKRSGAMMTWQYFHPTVPAPLMIQYIQDRDLWTKALPDCDAVAMALRSYPMEFELWDTFNDPKHFQLLVKEGRPAYQFMMTLVKECVAKAYPVVIGDYEVMLANCPRMLNSEVGEALAQGYPFGATYREVGPGVREYSLRSRGAVNVADIAKEYGGGGHAKAAGFTTNSVVEQISGRPNGTLVQQIVPTPRVSITGLPKTVPGHPEANG